MISAQVWAAYFIAPNAVILWLSGLVALKIRELLHGLGIVKERPCNTLRENQRRVDGVEAP